MAISKQRAQSLIETTATNILDVINTSGVDLGSLHIANLRTDADIQLSVSIVPTGATAGSGNAILWNTMIGATGFLSLCQPMFMTSGDKLQMSGSAPGLISYVSYLKLN